MKTLILLLTLSCIAIAAEPTKEDRGLLPELKLDDKSEERNEMKAMSSELMISRAEDKAIQSLTALLKKNKGKEQESSLLYRLAELYMRKSKTGRFFDLHQDSKTLKLSPFPIPPQKGKDWVRKASATYYDIERRFPNFYEMDGVLFNNAFASQQIGDLKGSENLYKKLLNKFPNSPLIPDGLLALGELLYDQARFKEARDTLENIERFPQSRIYSYGLYKWAWTLYNMKQSEAAVAKLVEVVEKNPVKFENTKRYNLRQEALRDLVLFVNDTKKADELYSFFKKIAVGDELGEAMMNLAKLYQSYNREKDIHIFLNEFLENEKNHTYRVRAHAILIDAFENIKKRDLVLVHLEQASLLCEPNAVWRARQEPAWAEETCNKDFRSTSLEIAKKWWDIWTKNKSHGDFSKLTEKALRLVLKGDEGAVKPDFKTRFALAELLFQQGLYDEASVHYETVGKQSTDPVMVHNADYAALYSVQKSSEKAKSSKKSERIKNLSLYYIQKHPKGQHNLPVQLQVALAEYESNNDKEAEKYLIPLADQNSNKDVRRKSQDLLLDIYNLRKDYPALKKMASSYLKEADTDARKASLQKIYEEAHYSDVQNALKTKPKIEVAEMLMDFRRTHPHSALSKEALWQALSLSYSEGFSTRGADMATEFAKTYPDDKRTADALKESADSYLAAGRVAQALDIYKRIIKTKTGSDRRKMQELISDLSLLEGERTEARNILQEIMKSSSGSEKRALLDRIMETFSEKEKGSKEFKQFETQLLSQGIEPYSTLHLTKQARQQLEEKNYSQAFATASKAMSRDVDAGYRAEARYIQARILEQELVSQGVKTSKEDRLSMVLNLKTEKLDKALTAYNSAVKMTKDPVLLMQMLEGADRCYSNYVNSLKNMELPSSLSPEDQAALRAEIDKIVAPIQSKQMEHKEAMVEMMKKAPATSQSRTMWSDLRAEETVPVSMTGPGVSDFKAFMPDEWKVGSGWDQVTSKKPACRSGDFRKDTDQSDHAELLAECYLAQNFKIYETEALALTDTPTKRAWGLFYLSFAAEKQGLLEKALWLTEKALASDEKNEVYQYQRARLLAQMQGMEAAYPEFVKLFITSKLMTDELKALRAVHHAKLGDWLTTKDILSKFTYDQLYKMNLLMLYAEAQNKSGDTDAAVNVISSSKMKNTLEGWLYLGKVFEVDKPELPKAQDFYKKALSIASSSDLKTWIEKKIDYLSNLKK